jgi:hypothetical protein
MKANNRGLLRRITLLQDNAIKMATALALSEEALKRAEARIDTNTTKQLLLMERLIEAEQVIEDLNAKLKKKGARK